MGSGKFCSECGTSFEIASTPRALLREDAAETIGLDRRLRSTLVDLLRHPVRIVSAYVRGDRSRYIPPFKLFFTLGGLYMLRISDLALSAIMSIVLMIGVYASVLLF
jgi:hypothetical protein